MRAFCVYRDGRTRIATTNTDNVFNTSKMTIPKHFTYLNHTVLQTNKQTNKQGNIDVYTNQLAMRHRHTAPVKDDTITTLTM